MFMAQIKFGTDGWRAIIAEDFTFANVARVAQATGGLLEIRKLQSPKSKIFDELARAKSHRRLLTAGFYRTTSQQITAEVFAGNNFQVVLTPEPTPTPSVSFAVKDLKAIGGVMITASHNPPSFNGFKLKSHYSGSSDSETCG